MRKCATIRAWLAPAVTSNEAARPTAHELLSAVDESDGLRAEDLELLARSA
jgi:hypothetical protein